MIELGIPDAMLWPRFETEQQRIDACLFMTRISETVTRSFFETWVWSCGGELLDCHCVVGAVDVVGIVEPWQREIVEEMRMPGLWIRYFGTHRDRLAEFQARLDLAKKRRRP